MTSLYDIKSNDAIMTSTITILVFPFPFFLFFVLSCFEWVTAGIVDCFAWQEKALHQEEREMKNTKKKPTGVDLENLSDDDIDACLWLFSAKQKHGRNELTCAWNTWGRVDNNDLH